MGGMFGASSKGDCLADLFYGTDYHSHLGTRRGGMVVRTDGGFKRNIHDITNAQFRSKFEEDLPKLHGPMGIGVISDYEDQPMLVNSHHGRYALATVGRAHNLDRLVEKLLANRGFHLAEMKSNEANQTEVVAALINQGENLVEGMRIAQQEIEGSCSMLLLAPDAIYAARDRLDDLPNPRSREARHLARMVRLLGCYGDRGCTRELRTAVRCVRCLIRSCSEEDTLACACENLGRRLDVLADVMKERLGEESRRAPTNRRLERDLRRVERILSRIAEENPGPITKARLHARVVRICQKALGSLSLHPAE